MLSLSLILQVPGGLERIQRVPILSITFEGNAGLSTTQIKAKLRFSREGGWYHPDTLKGELRALEAYYQDEGFLNARIGDPVVEIQSLVPRGQMAVIRVPVTEGPRYAVGKVEVRNAETLGVPTLLQMSPLRTGQPYSRIKVFEWKAKIEEAYQTLGYIRAELAFKEDVQPLRRVVDCLLDVKEGFPYKVGKILVRGDGTVDEAAFRKQILLGEGSLYNPEMLSLSLQFINTLRQYLPLTEADVETRIDDEAHKVDLVFKVVALKKTSPDSHRDPSLPLR